MMAASMNYDFIVGKDTQMNLPGSVLCQRLIWHVWIRPQGKCKYVIFDNVNG